MSNSRTNQIPQRDFSKYSLYHVQNESSLHVNDSAMATVSVPHITNGASSNVLTLVDIGFNFSFNGVTYKKVAVTEAGWCALVEPVTASVQLSDFVASSSLPSASIDFKTSGFTAQHVMLCPWVTDTKIIQSSVTASYRNTSIATRNSFGKEPAPSGFLFDEVEYGIRSFIDNQHSLGRRFILRWNGRSVPNNSQQAFRLKYDVVLYENGRIEFNYGTKQPPVYLYNEELTALKDENVFVGIICSTANTFRDFSFELGKISGRSQYEWGGAIYSPTYSLASGAKFNNQLSYAPHWPATAAADASLVFSPPAILRKVLRNTFQQTANDRSYPNTNYGNDSTSTTGYDDRETIAFTVTQVEYPTGLPRFHGQKQRSTLERQNLFANEFSITGSVIPRSAAGEHVKNETNSAKISPFAENVPDLVNTNDVFFRSGSNPEFYTGLLSGDVRQKKHIHLKLPVNYTTKFLTGSAITYYYSPVHRQWLMPPATTSVTTGSITGSRPVTDNEGITLPYGSGRIIVPFSAAGFFQQYSTFSGDLEFPVEDLITALGTEFDNGFGISKIYEASDDYTFEIPISQPWLLESAVIKFPIAAGTTWLNDYTNQIDVDVSELCKGPLTTFALFHQQKNSFGTSRSLILSGTFDSARDFIPYITGSKVYNTPGVPGNGVFTLTVATLGLNSSTVSPSFLVSASTTFTGTVEMQCEAAQNNGVMLAYFSDYITVAPTASYNTASMRLRGDMISASPFGRSKAGVSNGQSIFGKEYAFDFKKTIHNPFYDAWSSGRIIDNDGFISNFTASTNGYTQYSNMPFYYNVKSPYLLNPGDRLLLVISKEAPSRYLKDTTGSTTGHDLQLKPGNIELSMYGSYIKENTEHVVSHDKQQLVSNAVHSVIGDEPVLDQRLGTYRVFYSGTYNDNMKFGSLFDNSTFTAGLQTSVSKTSARLVNYLSSGLGVGYSPFPLVNSQSFDTNQFTSYSFVAQPMWSRAGLPQIVKCTSDSERYYDTMTPSFTECAHRLNVPIVYDSFFDYIWVNFNFSSSIGAWQGDATWCRSFPFEPTFNDVSRLQTIANSFVSTVLDDGLTTIPPIAKSGILPVFSYNQIKSYFIDFNTKTGYQSFSDNTLTKDTSDIFLKILYGFGNAIGDLPNAKLLDSWYYTGDADLTQPAVNASRIRVSPIIAGWKYGLRNGIAEYSTAVFRPDHFGQFRDMLEQREQTKFLIDGSTTTTAPVTVKFVDATGTTTLPENTWSSNLSIECTSSLPFFDGLSRNRNDININTLNQGIVTLTAGNFGNVTI